MSLKNYHRRSFLIAGLCAGAAGCRWRREPVVTLGGAAVRSNLTMMQTLRNSNDHQSLVQAIDRAGLSDLFERAGPHTLFAPNDRAFTLIRPRADEARMMEDSEYLAEVLKGHIVEADVTSEEIQVALPSLADQTRLIAMNDTLLRVAGIGERLRLIDERRRGANVVFRDALAANGVIHSIDNVLLPPKSDES